MNQPQPDPLLDLMAPLRTPPVAVEKRDRALALALAALEQEASGHHAGVAWRPWVALAGSLCVVLVAAWWLHLAPSSNGDPAFMLTEMEKLFPQQLDSVVVDGSEVQVNVAQSLAATPVDQRIRLVLQREGRSLGVLTYSGRKVCLKLDGQEICLTPLLRGDGSVFVLTEGQVIQDHSSILPTGHHIDMEHLKEVNS
jgi:hypothetical protein